MQLWSFGGRVGRTLPAERLSHECRPPVALLVEMPVLVEGGPRLLVNRRGALASLVARDPFALEHAAADLRMQNLVGPVVIVKVRRQRVARRDGGLVLVTLTRVRRHQRLLDRV